MSASDHRDGRAGKARGESNLRTRAASVAVLAPIALIASYLGGWLFAVLCMIAAAGILWEWTSLAAGRAEARVLVPGGAGLLIAGGLAALSLPIAAAGVVLAEAVLAALAIIAWPRDDERLDPAGWAAGGVVYAGAALVPSITLRNDPNWGLAAIYFLFAIVWITDILAYFCGRLFGGPLLWPAVSPKKTWSGAIAGTVGGMAAGLSVAYAAGTPKLWMIGIMAFFLSVLSQGGDLFESSVKRQFGAKDASQLIPGHGGLMDRLDGYIAAALAAALIGVCHGGVGSPGKGLLVW
ncbi:MAG: phosphatidate cytidylyltransferase [Hyphomicrobiales bacterium]|nr:phosphatidate cytidylyltransferase [Hyphomicrobiales bacterium]